ncbi:hypothetical protein [Streptomyces carpinensis]|uniref:Uncharacterized protein n=1 Tax=Streptomyces carpinensis TaxID=66369 RepID=A0ABV1VVQ3_9ACTN|nr:hypothetical protein [Streptomyces carpinensis]
MSYDEGPEHEPFGPEYVRPKQADCPNCPCCTEALCKRGRTNVIGCAGHVDPDNHQTVLNCPCAAEETPGTMAWHMARIRAVSAAKGSSLPAETETLLRAIDTGQPTDDPTGRVEQLTLRRYVTVVDGRPQITQFGRLYLDARVEPWAATALVVQDVDQKACMAQVVVARWSADVSVSVPMYQLANPTTFLGLDELPGVMLHGYANTGATAADDVVLINVTNPRLASQPSQPPQPPYKPGGLIVAPTFVLPDAQGPEPAGGEG